MRNSGGFFANMTKATKELPLTDATMASHDGHRDGDSELGTTTEIHLKRNLKSRHLQMIAIGKDFLLLENCFATH